MTTTIRTAGRKHAEYLPELVVANAEMLAGIRAEEAPRKAAKEARRAAGRVALAKMEPDDRAAVEQAYGGSL